MRIERLDLIRYGRFTDHRLDFGARPDGPDLHIVFGANEAGKSTLFSAWLDLLYRIPNKTPYGFLHPPNRMAIGARLDLDGQGLELVRTTQNQGALQDQHGNPLPETVIGPALGGFGRSDYTRSFSLDDDTLETGGDSILRSEGELGRLLFASSAGLASVAEILEQASAEADAIHKTRSQSSEIARLKKEREALQAELKRLDTGAADYERLVKADRQARDAYAAVSADLAREKTTLKETSRLVQALSGWGAIQRLRDQLAPLAEVPDYPADWAKELAALEREQAELRTGQAEKRVLLERLAQQLAEIAVDPVVLTHQEAIDRALETLDRFTTALHDLPVRERDLATEQATIADLRRRIGAPDGVPDRKLTLPTPVTSRLRALIEQRAGLDSALAAARTEAAEAALRHEEAEAELAALPATLDVSELERVRAEVGSALEGLALTDLDQRTGDAGRRLDEAMAALAPWHGAAEALLALPVPAPESLAERKAELAAAREAVRRAGERLVQATEEAADAVSALEAAQSDAVGIDDDATAAVRTERDALWQTHKDHITSVIAAEAAPQALEVSAAAFEAALRADDRVGHDRAARAQAVTAHRQAAQRTAEAARKKKVAQQQAEAAGKALQDQQRAFGQLLSDLGLPADWRPEDLSDWLARRGVALTRRTELADLTARLTAARTRVSGLEETLRNALAPIVAGTEATLPEPATLPTLRALAERLCAEARLAAGARDAARKRLREATRDLSRRDQARTEAEAAQQAWAQAWVEAVGATWLGEARASPPDPTELRAVLSELGDLQSVLEKARGLTDRIAKMRTDKDAFAGQIATVLAALATEEGMRARLPVAVPLDPEDGPAVRAAADWLRKTLDQARRSAEARDRMVREHAEAEQTLAAIERRLARHAARLQEMQGHFGVDSPEALRAALMAADEKRRLGRDLESRQNELVQTLALPSLAEAEARMTEALATGDGGAALRSRLDELETHVERLSSEAQAAYHEAQEAARTLAAVGGDDAVTRLEERIRAVDRQLEDAVDRYLRLHIGSLATDEALRRYRDRHRSEMMALAGHAFRTITGGRFTGLTTVVDKSKEVVLARRANGATLSASDMSKGTRFQLYLALRIAGYQQLATLRGGTLPFIADDILETSDDARSRHALTMLAEMARVGQVIYLTHHRHLVEQAREVAGAAVTVHTLPAPGGERLAFCSATRP